MVGVVMRRGNVVHNPFLFQFVNELLHRFKRTHECRRGHDELLVYFARQFALSRGRVAGIVKHIQSDHPRSQTDVGHAVSINYLFHN